MSISLVISTYNRSKKLKECLDSVKDIADEIVVVDNSSEDDSVSVAKKYTKNVFIRPNNPMLNVNKNFGFGKASKEWILYLDDDEKLTEDLKAELKNLKESLDKNPDISGYWIPRKNMIFRKWIQHGIWWPDYQMRLFKNGKGKYEEKHVHEMIKVDGPTERLKSPLEHENYTSISQYLYKLDKFYTENEAERILESGKNLEWFEALKMPVGDFLKTFFLQEGYKDGLHGLVLSILQAFYSEIVFVKVWEKRGFKEYNSNNFINDVFYRMKIIVKEFNYWFLTVFINETKNPIKRLILKINRKKQII